MYWADKLIQNLDKNKKHRVDDMKTPSGHAHVGSLRAMATHGLVYEAMKHAGFDVDFTYVVNDMDPMDGLPVYLKKEEYEKHMGKPLYQIPAPDGMSGSYAMQYANEYIDAFNKLGFKPEIIWSSRIYQDGKMNELIRQALDSVDVIRKIYLRVAKQQKPKNWYPLQVICPQCGKIGTTLVTNWDGKVVTFECQANLVKWAIGCGLKGKISPFDGAAKLIWKVDWPAHWVALNITVEGAGKDHLSAGGSRDIGVEIVEKVFNKKPPFGFLHEFFLFGGAKMSSSKGIGLRAADLDNVIPPTLARFLFVRTPVQRAMNFQPENPEVIPDLFDDYDRCATAWFESGDKTTEGRMFEATQIDNSATEKQFLPRFRQVTKLVQMPGVDLVKHFAEDKGSDLTTEEIKILDERVKYAKIWIREFASVEDSFDVKKELPESAKKLTPDQKEFLKNLRELLTSREFSSGEELQQEIFELAKKNPSGSKAAFGAIYTIFLDKTFGPKAGWFLADLLEKDKKQVLDRLGEI